MPESNFMAELSWDAYAERLASGAIVLVPVGAHEQHGRHLPLGTDTIEVTELCRDLAERIDAVVTPAIPFGYRSQVRSGGGNHWPGNIALAGDTLVRLLRDVLVALGGHGATRIAVIDAHYENPWFSTEACELAAKQLLLEGRRVRIVRVLCWDAIPPDDWAKIYASTGPIDLSLAHAGLLEASAMLHLAPHLVDLSREPPSDYRGFPPYDVYPTDPESLPASGALSSPAGSTAELGRLIMESMAQNLVHHLRHAFVTPDQESLA